uniref:Nucleoside-diphosphate kinase n=1 Tax=Dendroctonus ponderosae TaxID=77166 RepID=A0AAR5P5V4_DENPD
MSRPSRPFPGKSGTDTLAFIMSCNIKPNKTNYYIPQSLEFEDFEISQTVLSKAEYLTKAPFSSSKSEVEIAERCDELYAYVNSYYSHTEDADPLSKVNSLLAQTDILEYSRQKEAERRVFTYDAYSEREAQLRYLESKPVSFIILGKPDIGQQELGRELANYWNCVYIQPQALIEEEIQSGSRAGECIEFNLRCGRAIGIDIILKLVEQKVKSEAATHRGFVLCGLPVIPNDLYEEDPVSSQSAIFTAQDIFEEVFTYTTDLCIAPSNPQVSVSSKYFSEIDEAPRESTEFHNLDLTEESEFTQPATNQAASKEQPNIGKNYEKQLEFLFGLLEEPYFIIYIQCGSLDVLNKRDSYRFDIASKTFIDLQRRSYNHTFRSRLLGQDDLDMIDEVYDMTVLSSETFRLKHLMKMPGDFKANVSSQLDQYHYVALNFIQNRVLAHNPEYFVKVDGRTSISRMLSLVKAKLINMNVQKVLIPFKLTEDNFQGFYTSGEILPGEDADEVDNQKNINPKDCFKQFSKQRVPSRGHLWSWSEWGSKCPVSMKMGFVREGSVKYPVQFMSKLFFLADQDCYSKFYSNPRPFLLPPFPRPTCRIFIFGPKKSGRSALAQCLAYYLGGSVLSTDQLMHEFMQQRQDEYLEKVRQQAIAEGIALLNKTRALEADELEKERIEKIKDWVKTTIGLLEEMSNLLSEIEKEEKQEKFEISSFPMAMKKVHTTELLEDSEYAVGLLKLREQLQELNIPIYKLEAATWKLFLTERRRLLQYLPADLAQKCQPKPATVFDDFVKEYVATALGQAGLDGLQISGGSVLEMFIAHIKIAEEKYQKQGFGRGGWIIDGMMCNLKIIQDFFPDYTGDDIIVLKDSSNWLTKNFQDGKSTFYRDFRKFFMSMGLTDAAWRSPSLTSTQSCKEGLVKSILDDVLGSRPFYPSEDTNEKEPKLEEYEKGISAFLHDWEAVHEFYIQHNINPVEIDVANKSLPELFQYAIKCLDSKYTYAASRVAADENDGAEETPRTLRQESVEESPSPDQTQTEDLDEEEEVRRYGDTLHYCPVTLSENFVLWRGKEAFSVKYNEKTHHLATELDMQKFLDQPRSFLPSGYPTQVPPPRICVIGVSGCGKTHLTKALSDNYGLICLDYQHILKEFFQISSGETLNQLAEGSEIKELRSYLRAEVSLPSHLQLGLSQYWQAEPFKSKGFVFDDFPKTHYDVDFMVQNKLIPDLIIYPHADEEYLKVKFLERNVKIWQESMEIQRQESEQKHNKALDKWREQRSVRFTALIEERRDRRYAKKRQSKPPIPESEPNEPDLKSSSLVTFDSVADQEDIDEVNKVLDTEFPPISYEPPAANLEAFVAAMEPLISHRVASDTRAIAAIKEKCLQENIDVVEVALNLDRMDKNTIACFLAAEPLKFRTKSYLESCYEVSVEVAERLLNSGYVFLSKFGRICPMQYYEKTMSLPMFQLAAEQGKLFPVIHRNYLYFIMGQHQCRLFMKDPLKYIGQEFRFPLLSFKVAITGPPKCGKTLLSQKIQQELGLKLVTRGQALRYVLDYLFNSDLAKNMEAVLRKGWELTDEMVIKAVEAATFDPRVVAVGVVYDGFPNSLSEAKHMAYLDLTPNITIDLQASKEEAIECLSNYSPNTNVPKFSTGFLSHLYEEWSQDSEYFREWFDREYQALTRIKISTSNWSVWAQSREYLLSTFSEISHYHKHIIDDWPLRLGNMLITPLEFLERQSNFKTYCPVCLHLTNSLVSGGDPPDRTGLIQYRSHFYWVCDDHVALFLKIPDQYLPPYNLHGLPASLPKKTAFDERPENIYEDGACAVCYKNKRIIKKGELTLAVAFNDKAYLFDSVECLNTFLRNPSLFMFGIEFHAPVYPALKYRELPLLGMLEQYVAKNIVEALSYIAKRRPIIPGLSIAASALVGVGLYIKVRNDTPNAYKSFYETGLAQFSERRENLLKYLDYMKTYRNPYLHYEEPLPQFQLPPAPPKAESLSTMMSRLVDKCVDDIDMYLQDDFDTSDSQDFSVKYRVPVPDDRFDYLCEYFKPLSKVPAFLNIVDIAGLVKGASEGQGLGNAFLSHISACDAIFHLCRAFEDDDVTHVEGEVNPVRDLDIIAEELRLKDEDSLMKHLEKLERTVLRGSDKKQKPDYDALSKVKTILVDEKKHIRFGDWDSKEIEVLNRYLFLTSKPCIYLVNLAEKDYIKKKNKWLIKIKEWVDKNDPGSLIIPFSGAFEHKLVDEFDDPILRKKHLEEVGVPSALDKIIVQGYKALQLEYFFTAGADEVKAWTIQKGTKAPQAAGRIHTDFEKGFIMAEVMKFQDFKEEGSEAACKGAGKYRQQGRNYVVEDGDIIFFKFNAGAGLKDAKKK